MVRVVFLGPPGAGKGTQASQLAREWGIPHLSTGDLLRAAIRDRTELGKEAEIFYGAGKLVPDELVLRMLAERLSRPDARSGCLLDGFPRTIAQAEALERLGRLDAVFAFEIPETLLLDRLTQRWMCPECGTAYNVRTQPPKTEGRCDRDGRALEQRSDDRPDAVRTRLRVYHEQSAPVLDFYRTRGLLRTVDAAGSPSEVAARIRDALGSPSSSER